MEKDVRQLGEVLDLEQVEEIFGHFSALTGLSLRLTDPEGELITATDPEVAKGLRALRSGAGEARGAAPVPERVLPRRDRGPALGRAVHFSLLAGG